MKILLASDIHNEFRETPFPLQDYIDETVDAVILAGDIDHGVRAIEWADTFGLPVFMVAGNHEYYIRRNIASVRRDMANAAGDSKNVWFLDNEAVEWNGITIYGGTMWTDYDLFKNQDYSMYLAPGIMNDYKYIKEEHDGAYMCLRPQTLLAEHKEYLKGVRPGVADIIISHHAPSIKSCINYKGYRYDDSTTAYYASNLDGVVAYSNAKYWVHGHTHAQAEYELGETCVVANPVGYPGQDYDWGPVYLEVEGK